MKTPEQILDLINKNQTSKADLIKMAMEHLPEGTKLETINDVNEAITAYAASKKAAPKPKKEDFHKVKLLKKYVPVGEFEVLEDEEWVTRKQHSEGTLIFAKAGQVIGVTMDVAKKLTKKNIAEFEDAE